MATSGLFSAATFAAWMRLVMAGGILAGPITPHQAGESKPGKPLSAIVGTLGMALARLLVLTVNARRPKRRGV